MNTNHSSEVLARLLREYRGGDCEYRSLMDEAADTIERLSAELERKTEALDDLQQAEAEYRLMHDRHGDGSQAAGRAWDLMRRAGDKARVTLNTKEKDND